MNTMFFTIRHKGMIGSIWGHFPPSLKAAISSELCAIFWCRQLNQNEEKSGSHLLKTLDLLAIPICSIFDDSASANFR